MDEAMKGLKGQGLSDETIAQAKGLFGGNLGGLLGILTKFAGNPQVRQIVTELLALLTSGAAADPMNAKKK